MLLREETHMSPRVNSQMSPRGRDTNVIKRKRKMSHRGRVINVTKRIYRGKDKCHHKEETQISPRRYICHHEEESQMSTRGKDKNVT